MNHSVSSRGSAQAVCFCSTTCLWAWGGPHVANSGQRSLVSTTALGLSQEVARCKWCLTDRGQMSRSNHVGFDFPGLLSCWSASLSLMKGAQKLFKRTPTSWPASSMKNILELWGVTAAERDDCYTLDTIFDGYTFVEKPRPLPRGAQSAPVLGFSLACV